MKNVKVIDSIMGSGKTSFAIQYMAEHTDKKFIFVTPFIDEVDRIKKESTNRNFKEPNTKHGLGTKLQSLKKLIANGENIVTTHKLFSMADDELIDLLTWENYTLIVDEVQEVISILQLKKGDIKILLNSGTVSLSDTNQVIWEEDIKLNTKYNEVKQYALSGNLYAVNNTAFVWNFPAKIFNLFEEVFIMTYLFDGQLQRYYYDLHNIQYNYYTVIKDGNSYKLVEKSSISEERTELKRLINIYDGSLNEIGSNKTALSKSWFDNGHNSFKVKQLKDNLYNYFRNIQKAKSDRILWTTFKDPKNKIKGNGFGKEEPKNKTKDNNEEVGKACFTAFNLRATNKYKHKDTLAFCLNRYMNPIEKHFFEQQNVKVNEDLLALSDLLQWLFRSAIRDGKTINIYIPSSRMRILLKQWLNNEI